MTARVTLPRLGIGTSPLGGMPSVYGHDVGAEAAIETVRRALEAGLELIDTSNNYGESERRIGEAIRRHGGLPAECMIATKADPPRGIRELTGRRVRESFAESLEYLGLDRVDIYYLHDPENFDVEGLMRPGGAVDAVQDLKRQGLVDRVGVAGGDTHVLERLIEPGLFDVVLNHNRFTILDQSAVHLMDIAVSRGMEFVNAAPYGSGLLAKPASADARYRYRVPDDVVLRRVEELRATCARFDVPLEAVALQFSMRDRRVASTLVGCSRPDRVDSLLANAELEIPNEIWSDLEEHRSECYRQG